MELRGGEWSGAEAWRGQDSGSSIVVGLGCYRGEGRGREKWKGERKMGFRERERGEVDMMVVRNVFRFGDWDWGGRWGGDDRW